MMIADTPFVVSHCWQHKQQQQHCCGTAVDMVPAVSYALAIMSR
jgi:hypothetical protein